MNTMTLQQIEQIDRPYLMVEEVAKVLCLTPQMIRTQARERPELLGFPVISCGTRTRVPKEGFLRFMKGSSHEENLG